MNTLRILYNALMDLDHLEKTAGDDDAVYRQKSRAILSNPILQKTIANALLAPSKESTTNAKRRQIN